MLRRRVKEALEHNGLRLLELHGLGRAGMERLFHTGAASLNQTCPYVPLALPKHILSIVIGADHLLRVGLLKRGRVRPLRGFGMVEFRARRAPAIPGRVHTTVEESIRLTGREKRRGVRLNSRVPVSVEWTAEGEQLRGETQTRVVGPYGCLLMLHQNLQVRQQIQLTNLVSKQSNPGVI